MDGGQSQREQVQSFREFVELEEKKTNSQNPVKYQHLWAEKEGQAEDRSRVLSGKRTVDSVFGKRREGFQETNNTGKPSKRGPIIDLWS